MKKFIPIVLGILVLSQLALADVPEYISVQGTLTNTEGVPVDSGSYLIEFRIYDVSTGGSALWNSGYISVDVDDNGIFSTDLGPVSASVFADPCWLEVQIQGEPVMSPRARITTSPFTFSTSRLLPGFDLNMSDKWINFNTASGTGLNWNGFSSIYDDGDLNIVTDDNMWFSAPGFVDINSPSVGLSGNLNMNNNYGIYFAGSSQGSDAARIYTTSTSNRLFVRAQDINNVAQFASYGLYLPRDVGISLYTGGDMRLGYASSSDDDTIYFDDGSKYIRWIDGVGEFRLNDDLYVTNNFRFDGEITPGASTCSDNQILKRVSGVWACAADSGIGSCSGCDADFVNEGQANSITSSMIIDGTVVNGDISNTAGIAWSKISCSDCIGAGNIGSGAVGSGEIIASQVQRRVSGTCAAGSSIRVVNEDGTVSCETDTDTSANTLCSGTSTYLDGEGNCDTITSYPGNCGADAVRVASTCRIIPDCDAETQTLNYDQTTDTWSCLTDDSGGTDTNAGTICSGTTTYLDGEGNCDNIAGVYVNQNGDTMTGALQFGNGQIYWDSVNSRLVIEVT